VKEAVERQPFFFVKAVYHEAHEGREGGAHHRETEQPVSLCVFFRGFRGNSLFSSCSSCASWLNVFASWFDALAINFNAAH
jgi:hypothetical protein